MDFSVECEKKLAWLFAEVEGLEWVGFRLPALAVPAAPGAWHAEPLSGRWSLARLFLWLRLGAAPLVTPGGLLSAAGKGILSSSGFYILLILWM